ncbi:MAG: LON peptidase substrate-binding domain-containing protein [Burkholderiales bacterium]
MWPFGGGAREPQSLPLFPLKTVLFPGGLLPIKVFEQRYIEMTKACLAEDRPFGVCLITSGDEVAAAGAPAPETATVGTFAKITQWDMPQLGILHLATLGGGRFQVKSRSVAASGLVTGEVLPIATEPRRPVGDTFAPLVSLLELVAARVGPQNFPAERDYDDASWVGYRLAELLPLPLTIKQSMLEINDADVRLSVLQKFLAQQGVL